MGGKHKQAQRTKNNTKPSNSGRSAEHLSSISNNLKDINFSLPNFTLSKIEDIDNIIDPEFQLVFKKINKKDSTTKLKALQEFSELIIKSDINVIKSILNTWSRLFSSLVIEGDHRIREAVHNAHYQIVLKEKRNLAPHLKQLIGPWFISQYDTYPPAASAATKSFETAFPSNKTETVLIYLQHSILTFIYTNLIEQSIENLVNTKNATQENAESKYERLLTSSLQGYSLYLDKISESEIHKADELNKQIISNSKFWKLSKHEIPTIRGSWFKVLTSLCQKYSFLLENENANVITIIVNYFDENEPTVLPYIWKSFLLSITFIEKWWTYINIEKVLLPKLWKVLKDGGLRNSTIIYPNLLPLLSKLPSSITNEVFYNNFFTNISLGLKQKNVYQCKSEVTAMSTTFIECIQYIIYKNNDDINLCENLIQQHLIFIIRWSLIEKESCCKIIFQLVSSMIKNWSRNRNNIKNYNLYLYKFWSLLYALFDDTLIINTQASERQYQFIHILKHPINIKKQIKVSFIEDNNINKNNDDNYDNNKINIINNFNDNQYEDELREFIINIINLFISTIEKNELKNLIQSLFYILQDTLNENFFNYLENSDIINNIINIFNKISMWSFNINLHCETIIDLIFIFFKFSSNDYKLKILELFKKIHCDECMGWYISKALTYPFNENIYIKNWLINDEVTKFLTEMVKNEINGDGTFKLKILFTIALTENDNEEILISKKAVLNTINILKEPLLKPNEYSLTIDSCASLASYISTVIYSKKILNDYSYDLLLALFNLSCNNNLKDVALTDDTLEEVNTSWQDAIIILSNYLDDFNIIKLVGNFANVIENEFMNKLITVDCLNNLLQNVFKLIQIIYKNKPLLIGKIYEIFFNCKFSLWKNDLSQYYYYTEFIHGTLVSPFNEFPINNTINEDNVLKYIMWIYLEISILSKNLEAEEKTNDNEEDNTDEDTCDIEGKDIEVVSKINNSANNKLILSIIEENHTLIAHFLYSNILTKGFINRFQMIKHRNCIIKYSDLIDEEIKELYKIIDQKALENYLIEKTLNEVWIWCYVIYYFYSQIELVKIETFYKNFLKSSPSDLAFLHVTYIVKNYISIDLILQEYSPNPISKIITVRYLLDTCDIDIQIAEIFKQIEKIRDENPLKFLYQDSNISWQKNQEIIEIIRFFTKLIKYKFNELDRRYWDFCVISLSSWSSSCVKLKSNYKNINIQTFIFVVSQLYLSISKAINEMKSIKISNNFINEWEDLFVKNIHSDMVQLWLYFSEELTNIENKNYLNNFIGFNKIVNYFNCNYIFNDCKLPKWPKLVKKCCILLLDSSYELQLIGYKMLLILLPGLVEIDKISVETNKPNEKGLIFEQFKDILIKTDGIVHDILIDYQLGENSCQIQQFTDSFTYTFAYLLLWDILLKLCEKASTELRYQYSDWLKNDNYFDNFLNNLIYLMPIEVIKCNENKIKVYQSNFITKIKININEIFTNNNFEHLVCWLYCMSLTQLPVLVRQWWSDKDTKLAKTIEKLTSLYVTPYISNNEIKDVANHENNFKNLIIRTLPTVREITAIYTIDEAQVELLISLPINYPLNGPEVHCNRQIGGGCHKPWLMQLKKCLLHQNGRIWDALLLWNNNLDKKFTSAKECCICYSVLHPGTYQLPKLACHTCRKKFHSTCLYKWFSTSNKSSCPICRNIF